MPVVKNGSLVRQIAPSHGRKLTMKNNTKANYPLQIQQFRQHGKTIVLSDNSQWAIDAESLEISNEWEIGDWVFL